MPFTAGSSSDTVARLVGQKLGERLGQQFVIENRVGAGGSIGTEQVARAEPDGHTVGLANTSTHAVAASLGSLGYDPVQGLRAGVDARQLAVRARALSRRGGARACRS